MEFLPLLHLPIKTKKSFTPKQPIVMKTPILFFVLLMGLFVGQAQERLIKGKVTDAQDNAGMPGVTVIIKGTELYDPERGGFVDLGILDVLQVRTQQNQSLLLI